MMNGAHDLSLEDFENAALTHGGDLNAWPADLQAHARRLAGHSRAARAALARAQALDAAIGAGFGAAPRLSETLTARILADAAEVGAPAIEARSDTRPRPARARRGWLAGLVDFAAAPWGPATACVLGALFGVWLGYAGPNGVAVAAEVAMAQDFGDGYGDEFAGLEVFGPAYAGLGGLR